MYWFAFGFLGTWRSVPGEMFKRTVHQSGDQWAPRFPILLQGARCASSRTCQGLRNRQRVRGHQGGNSIDIFHVQGPVAYNSSFRNVPTGRYKFEGLVRLYKQILLYKTYLPQNVYLPVAVGTFQNKLFYATGPRSLFGPIFRPCFELTVKLKV